MKHTFTLLFINIALFSFSQQKETVTFLGNTIEGIYLESDKRLLICNTGHVENCTSFKIKSEKEFDISNEIFEHKGEVKSKFKYSFLSSKNCEPKYDSILKKLKLEIESADDKEVKEKDSTEIKIKNYPSDYERLFLLKRIKNEEDKKFDYEISSSLLVENIIIKNDKDNPDLKELLESVINQDSLTQNGNKVINNIKVVLSKKIEKTIDDNFHDLLSKLYTNQVSKSEGYTILSNEKMGVIEKDEPKSTNFYYILKNGQISVKTEVPSLNKSIVFGAFDKGIQSEEFVNHLLNQHKLFKDTDDNKEVLRGIYEKIKIKNLTKQNKKLKTDLKESAYNRLVKLEKTPVSYSGQISLKSLSIPLEKCKDLKDKKCDGKTEKKFMIDSVYVRFLNHRIDGITVYGEIDGKKVINQNQNYSIPIKSLYKNNQTNQVIVGTDKYEFNYGNLLSYDYTHSGNFNYGVKNSTIKLTKKDSVKKVEEKKIGDYFTGVFFSDFLGLNSSNNLIKAEGRLRFPWVLNNWKKLSYISNINVDLNVALLNGLNDNNESFDEVNSENDSLVVDNFELLKRNNVSARINLSPFSYEWKGASTFLNLNYGVRFLRTPLKYDLITEENQTITKEQKTIDVFSLGHELDLQSEIKLTESIGLDLNAGLLWYNKVGNGEEDVEFNITNNSPNLKFMTNVYALLNPNKNDSGLHFRIGGYYSYKEKEIFPQIMVGYATSLSVFFNKFGVNN